MIEQWRQDESCFDEEVTGTKATVPKTSALGSSSGEGGFCSLETGCDRRTAPIPKLLVSAGRLQGQGRQSRETVLGSSPGEGNFFSSELSTIEERHQEQSCLFRRGDCRNKGHNPKPLPSVRVAVKIFCVPWKLMMAEHR
jgi:hypothetical protein